MNQRRQPADRPKTRPPTGQPNRRPSADQPNHRPSAGQPSTSPRDSRHQHCPEQGAATLEAVILTPVVLLFAALLLFAGRTALAHQAVQHAAWEAARAASLARNPTDANNTAVSQAASLLARLGCQPAVTVNTAGFNLPVTQPAQVFVAVACTIDVSHLALPGIPGTITMHATADSPLDRYRSRR